jgi:hypothetical protein
LVYLGRGLLYYQKLHSVMFLLLQLPSQLPHLVMSLTK